MKLKHKDWEITALFSNFDMDRLTRQDNCALFRELSLYNRELVYVTFSVQWYRNCNQI
jgi:hypothetical protein